MRLIYCRGGDKTALAVANAGGMSYGIRNDYHAYSEVYMIDYNWKIKATPERWAKYMTLLKNKRPKVALVPDFESLTQLPALLEQIKQVASLGITPMVCPKFLAAVSYIPDGCIIAISVPTRYAGFLPQSDELKDRSLHFLGGHPDQHLYLMRERYKNIKVVSIDANALAMKAGNGQYWSALKGDWVALPVRRFSDLTIAKYSAQKIREYLFDPQSKFKYNRRVQKCMVHQFEFNWIG